MCSHSLNAISDVKCDSALHSQVRLFQIAFYFLQNSALACWLRPPRVKVWPLVMRVAARERYIFSIFIYIYRHVI